MATPLPISAAMIPTPSDGPRTDGVYRLTQNANAARALNPIHQRASLRTLPGCQACVLIKLDTPNEQRSQDGPRASACKPDALLALADAIGWPFSSIISEFP